MNLTTVRLCILCNRYKTPLDFEARRNQCRSCVNQRKSVFNKKYKATRNGCFIKCLSDAKQHAKKRETQNREQAGICTLTIEDIIEILEMQNGLCFYSKIPMNCKKGVDWQPSIQRLDNNFGYVRSNVVLCCLEFNHSTTWTDEKIQILFALIDSNITVNVEGFDFEMHSTRGDTNGKKYVPIIVNETQHYTCNKCGITQNSSVFYTKLCKKSGTMKWIGNGCFKCHQKKRKNFIETLHGHLETMISRAWCRKLKKDEKKTIVYRINNDFDIDKQTIIDLFKKQKGKCAYSNVPLNFFQYAWWTASIERINSLKGYTKNNVCLIAYELNTSDYSVMKKGKDNIEDEIVEDEDEDEDEDKDEDEDEDKDEDEDEDEDEDADDEVKEYKALNSSQWSKSKFDYFRKVYTAYQESQRVALSINTLKIQDDYDDEPCTSAAAIKKYNKNAE